ncbi:MAG: cytochrome c3 family protein, partial [Acidobacteria bacterium]|nr:cytochrome c3 family protein [Acidobacteriota bacterium]
MATTRPTLPLVLLVAGLLSSCGGEGGGSAASGENALDLSSATFVGRDACRSCHAAETAAWRGSHHDLALDVATDSTVIGDFDDASFSHLGITHRFFRRDGGYWVETEGPDGVMAEYRVTHVIGVEPLQQYLTPFSGGRLQTLPTTWDARPASEGGQRWYHIYGDERIEPDDPLFWTTVNQNWNHQCAECHSTDLRKGYRSGADTYRTEYEEIDVSCEACHGPASVHVERALAAEAGGTAYKTPPGGDLPVRLAPPPGAWMWSDRAGKPVRSAPPGSNRQIDTCARCHARRGAETSRFTYGEASFLDTHRPSTPRAPLYFHDGQILDEVYVYGSFLQSRMYQAGVLCSDCHEPHSNGTRAPGPLLCMTCHSAAVYDGPQHDFHPRAQAAGPSAPPYRRPAVDETPDCLSCHMTERTYMGVDDRGDHSFRIPRPDLTRTLGSPNACNGCHSEEGADWATDHLSEWYGSNHRGTLPHYGVALAAAAEGGPAWPQGLVEVIETDSLPAIVRAAAVEALA